MKEKVARVPDITRAEWLELRRAGFGGSDAGTIAGLNPYNSLYSLYWDKQGTLPEIPDNEAMRQGRDLEDYVSRRFMEKTGKKVRKNLFMWRSTENPFMLADVDREIVGENAGLECKTASARTRYDFDGGEIPLHYYAQCCHYMAVMGWSRVYLAVLVMGSGFYVFEIDRDENEISALVERERAFYENHIMPKIPPAADGTEATARALQFAFRQENGPEMETPKEWRDRLRELQRLQDSQRLLNGKIKELKAGICADMGETEVAAGNGWRVSWKWQTAEKIDSKALKKEMPEVFAKYSRTASSRVFRFKEMEE